MSRDKAWRRVQREKKIAERRTHRATEHMEETGRLDKNHYGCGCAMCKPWKHKAFGEPRYKHSEMRKLQESISLAVENAEKDKVGGTFNASDFENL